jgi:rhodanese-related sulfurtransferase
MTILYVCIGAIVALVVFNKIKTIGVTQCSVDEAGAMIKRGGLTLLDVRTQGEFQRGHIRGAKLIPVSDLAGRIGELGLQKDQKILVYCHSGSRSLAATRILRSRGFNHVTNLRGGTVAWISKGGAVTNGN